MYLHIQLGIEKNNVVIEAEQTLTAQAHWGLT